jgi:hypothetical protein
VWDKKGTVSSGFVKSAVDYRINCKAGVALLLFFMFRKRNQEKQTWIYLVHIRTMKTVLYMNDPPRASLEGRQAKSLF